MRQKIRTDWLSLLFSLIAPAIVVTWFAWAALQPPTKDPENWAWYVAALFPFEGVRLLITQLMRVTCQSMRLAAIKWLDGGFLF